MFFNINKCKRNQKHYSQTLKHSDYIDFSHFVRKMYFVHEPIPIYIYIYIFAYGSYIFTHEGICVNQPCMISNAYTRFMVKNMGFQACLVVSIVRMLVGLCVLR